MPPRKNSKANDRLAQTRDAVMQGTDLQRCIRFFRAMHWHLQFDTAANTFRVKAYNVAAEALQAHGSLTGLTRVPGIGAGMRTCIESVVSGELPQILAECCGFGPPFTVSELTRIPGVGPKTALKLYESLGVISLADMEKKIQGHEITDPKLVQGFYDMSAVNDRIPRQYVIENVSEVLTNIQQLTTIVAQADETARAAGRISGLRYRGRVILAGSIRRMRPDIRDVDVLVEIPKDKKAADALIAGVLAYLRTLGAVNINNKEGHKKAEIQVEIAGKKRKLDVNFLKTRSWGTAVLHFTGPSQYNVMVRKHALKMSPKLTVSQYGIKDEKAGKTHRFSTEKKALAFLGLPCPEPELRDMVTNVAVKPKGIVKVSDVFADLHTHTTDSDGLATIGDMANFMESQNRITVLGVTNHSKRSGNGLKPEQVRGVRQSVNHASDSVTGNGRLLFGSEVDILPNGTLDYSDNILQQFQYVLASIHHKIDFNTTERYLSAIEKLSSLKVPAILAHISGRIIGHRPAAEADYFAVFEAAAKAGIAIEINGQWDRCDASDELLRKALRAGCMFAVNSDYHGKNPVKDIPALLENAVMQARRGWIPKERVLNANMPLFVRWLDNEMTV